MSSDRTDPGAGRYGMMWMFLGLGIGFVGFVAKGIIQKLLGIE